MSAATRVTLACIASGVLFAASLAAQQSADVALRAAIETETIKGDVNAAIEQYQRLSNGANRGVAAQALVRLAEAHQKRGDGEAQQVYERIVREFGDQRDAVLTARNRLARNGRTRTAVGDRAVKAGPDITYGDGNVSPDGRFISYTDWNGPGNLMLHDLATGNDRRLTDTMDGNSYASAISPDGKQIAYGWRSYTKPVFTNELRVARLDGTGVVQPRRIYGNDDIDTFNPTDWSPDGQTLAAFVTRKDRTGQIALVGVRDGSFKALKSTGWRGPNKVLFSPDGKYLAYDLPATDSDLKYDVFVLAADGSREIRAVQHTAHDVVMGWSRDGSRLLFASDRTGPASLWAVPIADGRITGAQTLLKPDIGSMRSTGISADGTLYVVKDASTAALQIAPLDLGSGTLGGAGVTENFQALRPNWSRDGRLLAYVIRRASGLPTLAIRDTESGQLRELHPSLLYFNEPRWSPDGRWLVVFGRSVEGRGGVYRIDAETGRESLIAEADLGPVQISPDGRKIYYEIGFVTLGVGPQRLIERDLASGSTREVMTRDGFNSTGNVELSPDGRWLAMIATDDAARTSAVIVRPVAGGQAREVLRVNRPEMFNAYGHMSWTSDGTAVVVSHMRGDNWTNARWDSPWVVPIDGGRP